MQIFLKRNLIQLQVALQIRTISESKRFPELVWVPLPTGCDIRRDFRFRHVMIACRWQCLSAISSRERLLDRFPKLNLEHVQTCVKINGKQAYLYLSVDLFQCECLFAMRVEDADGYQGCALSTSHLFIHCLRTCVLVTSFLLYYNTHNECS